MKAASAPRALRALFLLKRPAEIKIDEFLRSQRDEPFTYKEVGGSRNRQQEVRGYVVDHNRIRLGAGEEVFRRAAEALRGWQMFEVGWVKICWPDTPVEVGSTVAVLGEHYGFYSLNACRVVYLVEDYGGVRRFGFAYGTLTEHAESGEERFTIEWDRNDEVWYDLYAFSKPKNALARIGRPFARALQRRFARDSMRAMVRAVHPNSSAG